MIVYLVTEYGGRYEDAWEVVICGFEDKEEAEAYAEKIRKEIEAEHEQIKRCAECSWYDKEPKPDCYVPTSDDYCANEMWDIRERCDVKVEELELIRVTDKDNPCEDCQEFSCDYCPNRRAKME